MQPETPVNDLTANLGACQVYKSLVLVNNIDWYVCLAVMRNQPQQIADLTFINRKQHKTNSQSLRLWLYRLISCQNNGLIGIESSCPSPSPSLTGTNSMIFNPSCNKQRSPNCAQPDPLQCWWILPAIPSRELSERDFNVAGKCSRNDCLFTTLPSWSGRTGTNI